MQNIPKPKPQNYRKIFFIIGLLCEANLILGYFSFNFVAAGVVNKPSLIYFLLINQPPVILWATIFTFVYLIVVCLVRNISKKFRHGS